MAFSRMIFTTSLSSAAEELSLKEIERATKAIRPYIEPTPCLPSHFQDNFMMRLHYKLETVHRSGNFKERGALYAMLRMTLDKQKIGIVVASLGNAAIGFCVQALKLRIPVTVVLPNTVTTSKIRRCEAFGGRVFVEGSSLQEAIHFAKGLAEEEGLTFFDGRDDIRVLAGFGSVAMEIIEQVPNVDAVLVPVGVGGLIAATAKVIKQLKPTCKIYGVEMEALPKFKKSLEAGKMVYVPMCETMADSLNVNTVGLNSFYCAAPLVNKMIVVNEDNVSRAMLHLVEKERLVVEGAGACPLASIIANLVPELRLKTVVCILSGGNIDPTFFPRCLERGLAVEGRLVKFKVFIKDNIDEIVKLTRLLHKAGYSVKRSYQEHKWLQNDVYKMEMSILCQTKNIRHAFELKHLLENTYPNDVVFETHPFNDRGACCCIGRKYRIKWV